MRSTKFARCDWSAYCKLLRAHYYAELGRFRIKYGRRSGNDARYNEKWLQLLLLVHISQVIRTRPFDFPLPFQADSIRPWWRIDLGDDYFLGTVTVYLRLGCCGKFLDFSLFYDVYR